MGVKVFSDESGTMPDSDEGDVFLVAAYAVASNGPVTVTTRPSAIGRHDWILAELARLAAKPSVALLSPEEGSWMPGSRSAI